MCCRLSGLFVVILAAGSIAAEPVDFAPLATAYQEQTLPILRTHCLECHSSEQHEGELDLERFRSIDVLRKEPAVWVHVREMIERGEMPPKDEEPLAPTSKQALIDWIDKFLHAVALSTAGDPGEVVLRRLTNAEYSYTVRDLIGVDLDPAREFPTDSAAGEGFTNTGQSLVMSPALFQKYLDAGRQIASHAVLLPDGIRFSPSATRGDWNNEILAKIRSIYQRHSVIGGAVSVNLQGVVFDTNAGGRIPLTEYFQAAFESLDRPVDDVAQEHGVNAKYLTILRSALVGDQSEAPGLLLADLRTHWREGMPASAAELTAGIQRWQEKLIRFQNVGHMKPWMVAFDPLAPRQEFRLKVEDNSPTDPDGMITVYLVADTAGDGSAGDFVVWETPRLVAPGRPDLLLRDARQFTARMTSQRSKLFASTAEALAAAYAASSADTHDLESLAAEHGLEVESLAAWLDYLGIGSGAETAIQRFTTQVQQVGGYESVAGWGRPETPSVIANSADSEYHVPGRIAGHGVCVHPAPTIRVAVGWKSPLAGTISIQGHLTHAHPECGNGVEWLLQLRRATTRRTLAEGVAHGGSPVVIEPIQNLRVEPGDLISLLVGPRDGNHACDLTEVDLTLTQTDGDQKNWNLSADVSGDILASNPHADSAGTPDVWHFYEEPVDETASGVMIPAGSVLARWQSASSPAEAQTVAEEFERLLVDGPVDQQTTDADVKLYRQLSSLGGPLLSRAWSAEPGHSGAIAPSESHVGLDPTRFGRHPDGSNIDPASLCVAAPSVIEVKLPAELVVGGEFVTSGALHPTTGREGSVQITASLSASPDIDAVASDAPTRQGFTAINPEWPIIVQDGSESKKRFEQSFAEFRNLFPAALCYDKIVPTDEVITLTLFHREDDNLRRLMLDAEQAEELDRLWRELHFVSRDKLTMVDAFLQLLEYASQDGRPSDFEPLRQPITQAAEEFKQEQSAAESKHLDAVIALAARAYRRPLGEADEAGLRSLYAGLRSTGIAHDQAIPLTIARIFIAPAFLYRLEQVPESAAVAPVTDLELASRLSYFLWSSMPDDELMSLASSGRLHEDEVLKGQVRRMLKDERIHRLGREFGCQWLQIYGFRDHDEKNERLFPEFAELRRDFEEEAVRFMADLFQNDGSVESVFDADHTFVNRRLAAFYGLGEIAGDDWQRIDGVRAHGRGGVLTLAGTLAKNSGASRTSPILRGTWVSEVILGEKLPKPPKNVPILPDDESAAAELTVRELTERHVSDEQCASCHRRIDPYGFAFENYDTIGRFQRVDRGNRPIDAKTTLPDGTEIDGPASLRDYLVRTKGAAVQRQFLRKLLGYSLGRSVQLSDEPLLDAIERRLQANDGRLSVAVEEIVLSTQFRSIRGNGTDQAGR